MSSFSGAPSRPVSFGIGARNAIANQPDVTIGESSQLCKSMFDISGVKRADAKCRRRQSGQCPYAHSLKELRMPAQHRLYSDEKGEISLTFSDWGNSYSASMTTTLSKCYRTKLTEAIASRSNVLAGLCYDWVFIDNCTVCPRWSNCWFLHPTAAVLAQMRQFFCRREVNPRNCDSVRCTYAHHPRQLEISLDFLRSVDAKAQGETMVEVFCTNGQKQMMSVPKMMLLDTHGRAAGCNTMCSSQTCDATWRCQRLHVHPAQWNRGVDAWARVVQHPGYTRPSPPQQFLWLKTIRENSDPNLFVSPPVVDVPVVDVPVVDVPVVDVPVVVEAPAVVEVHSERQAPSQQEVSRTISDALALRHEMYAYSMLQLDQPIDSRADILALFLLWTSNIKATPENAAIIRERFNQRVLVLLYDLLHQKVERAPAAVIYVWLITCFESIKIYATQYSADPNEALSYCEGAEMLLKKTEKRSELFIGVLHKEIRIELEKIKMLAA